jgi:salicylate hydroxylase
MAIEDAVTLGAALRATPDDVPAAFRVYQQARYLRTGRVQLTARFYGEIYHASGVMRELRNRMFQSGHEAAGFIGAQWLYKGIDPDRPLTG